MADDKEHKTAFVDKYLRKGLETGLAELEQEAKPGNMDTEAGYELPGETDERISELLRDISPLRKVANQVKIGNANYRRLVNTDGTASGWSSERQKDGKKETFTEIVPPLGELYANPAATQAMLDDAFFNVEEWLAEELAQEFGVKESSSFINGDGCNKPKGLLTYETSIDDDAKRPFGELQYLPTGVSGDFPVSDPVDILIDLIYSLRPVYRAGASFLMNTNLVAEIRNYKDRHDNLVFKSAPAIGLPDTILNYPVVEIEEMPDKAKDSFSIAFGNFQRGYIITDRLGTRLLRDPFSNKPFVHFYTTKRVGGGVVNSEAIKLLKFSAQ